MLCCEGECCVKGVKVLGCGVRVLCCGEPRFCDARLVLTYTSPPVVCRHTYLPQAQLPLLISVFPTYTSHLPHDSPCHMSYLFPPISSPSSVSHSSSSPSLATQMNIFSSSLDIVLWQRNLLASSPVETCCAGSECRVAPRWPGPSR